MKNPENKFEFINMFPYPIGIWAKEIENLDCDYWINKVYEFKKYNPNSVSKSNRGGWQSEDIVAKTFEFQDLTNLILSTSKPIHNSNNYMIEAMWINISSFGCYNTLHCHEDQMFGSRNLSGVLYLKVPKNSGKIIFTDPFDFNKVNKIHVEEKTILLFPDVLYHMVEPNLNQEDRISIAFNFKQ